MSSFLAQINSTVYPAEFGRHVLIRHAARHLLSKIVKSADHHHFLSSAWLRHR